MQVAAAVVTAAGAAPAEQLKAASERSLVVAATATAAMATAAAATAREVGATVKEAVADVAQAARGMEAEAAREAVVMGREEAEAAPMVAAVRVEEAWAGEGPVAVVLAAAAQVAVVLAAAVWETQKVVAMVEVAEPAAYRMEVWADV